MAPASNANFATIPRDQRFALQTLQQNRLLASLPAAELQQLSHRLELVELQRTDALHSPNQPLQFAYFPTTAIVSLQYTCNSGETAEIAGVGHEGVVGLALFMGAGSTTTSALVQANGHAFRLHNRHIQGAMERSPALRALLLHYVQLLLAQIAQTSVCNRHHRVEQQVCRWLLSMLDRVTSGTLAVTHEIIASALGVRREGVTEAAGNLQRAGVIRYQRGQVEVLQRDGLEARACECYAAIRRAVQNQYSAQMAASADSVQVGRHA